MNSSFRGRIASGQPLLGCFLTWPTEGVAEVLALAGFDFLVLDAEHGFFSIESIERMVIAADGAGTASIVRVPSCPAAEVGRSLDAGAAGILFPRVEGCASIHAAIETVKYPPAGKRGLGGVRANRYGTIPLDRFVQESNDQTVVVAQIETTGALAELAEIAAEPGVDVLFVGPNDLTQTLGVPGQYADPRYQEAVARIARQARASSKMAGIMLGRADQIPALLELGYRFFTTSDRTLLLESARTWRLALGRETGTGKRETS